MDKIDKSLLKIPYKQRQAILKVTQQIANDDFAKLDLKKLKGSKEYFRVRVGNYRIILRLRSGQTPLIVNITKRNEKTYKAF